AGEGVEQIPGNKAGRSNMRVRDTELVGEELRKLRHRHASLGLGTAERALDAEFGGAFFSITVDVDCGAVIASRTVVMNSNQILDLLRPVDTEGHLHVEAVDDGEHPFRHLRAVRDHAERRWVRGTVPGEFLGSPTSIFDDILAQRRFAPDKHHFFYTGE